MPRQYFSASHIAHALFGPGPAASGGAPMGLRALSAILFPWAKREGVVQYPALEDALRHLKREGMSAPDAHFLRDFTHHFMLQQLAAIQQARGVSFYSKLRANPNAYLGIEVPAGVVGMADIAALRPAFTAHLAKHMQAYPAAFAKPAPRPAMRAHRNWGIPPRPQDGM